MPTPYPTPISQHARWYGLDPCLPGSDDRPPFIGSLDFMDLFTPDAPWQEAAKHVQVFKLLANGSRRMQPMRNLKRYSRI